MRVLAVVDGEADACVQELAWRRLAPLGARASVSALLARCDAPLRARLDAGGVACTHAALAPSADWSGVRDVAAAARASDAQVLYAHGAAAHGVCGLAGALLRVPVVAQPTRPLAMADLHAHVTAGSTVVVATDHARLAALAAGVRDPVVVPTPARATSRHAAATTIAWAGSFHEAEGRDLFVAAAAAVAAVTPDVRFRMLVPNSRSAAVRDRVRRLPATVADLRFGEGGFASEASVFVHTAWHDAAHLTVVDALASDVPVVATTAGGSAELVRHGRELALYAPGDEAALIGLLLSACDHARAAAPVQRAPLPGPDDCAELVLTVLRTAIERKDALAA